MTILDRFITREFLRFFILIFISLLLISVIIDFFEKMNMFMSNGATSGQMFKYFLAALPMLASLVAPAAVLIASLVTMGSLSRTNELTALKAGGISLYRTSLPILLLAAFFSLIYFLFTEFVTPQANERADRLIRVEIQKQEIRGSFGQDELWYRGQMGLYNFRLFDRKTNSLFGITINQFDGDFRPVRRYDAEKAVFKDGLWQFHNLMTTSFSRKGEPILEWVATKTLPLPEVPDDFGGLQKGADKMGYFELRRYIGKLRSEGYDVTSYETDLQGKMAFSLVTVILAAIGVAFSLKSQQSGALARSIGVGLVVGFSYWILFTFFLSLGRSGALPPYPAAWLANLIFASGALYLFYRIKT